MDDVGEPSVFWWSSTQEAKIRSVIRSHYLSLRSERNRTTARKLAEAESSECQQDVLEDLAYAVEKYRSDGPTLTASQHRKAIGRDIESVGRAKDFLDEYESRDKHRRRFVQLVGDTRASGALSSGSLPAVAVGNLVRTIGQALELLESHLEAQASGIPPRSRTPPKVLELVRTTANSLFLATGELPANPDLGGSFQELLDIVLDEVSESERDRVNLSRMAMNCIKALDGCLQSLIQD